MSTSVGYLILETLVTTKAIILKIKPMITFGICFLDQFYHSLKEAIHLHVS